MIRLLKVGLINLSADHFQWFSIRIHLSVWRILRSWSYIAVRTALRYFNRFDVRHRSVRRCFEFRISLRSQLIFHVLVSNWT